MRRHPPAGEPVDKLARDERSDHRTGGIDNIHRCPAGQRHAGKFGQIDLMEQHAGDGEAGDHRQPDETKPETAVAKNGAPPPVIDAVDGDDVGIGSVVDACRRRRCPHPLEATAILIAGTLGKGAKKGQQPDKRQKGKDHPQNTPVQNGQQCHHRSRADGFSDIHAELCQ